MKKRCDNKSVGAIIQNEAEEILLLERKKFPFGFAAPAGHVDEFPSPEEAVRMEVLEEVGLTVTDLTLLGEGDRPNVCRRDGGTHHYWWVYQVAVSGEIKPSADETKQVGWYSRDEISALTARTEAYEAGLLSESDWESIPGLEPIWRDFFTEYKVM